MTSDDELEVNYDDFSSGLPSDDSLLSSGDDDDDDDALEHSPTSTDVSKGSHREHSQSPTLSPPALSPRKHARSAEEGTAAEMTPRKQARIGNDASAAQLVPKQLRFVLPNGEHWDEARWKYQVGSARARGPVG